MPGVKNPELVFACSNGFICVCERAPLGSIPNLQQDSVIGSFTNTKFHRHFPIGSGPAVQNPRVLLRACCFRSREIATQE